jgi:hypothetical protein
VASATHPGFGQVVAALFKYMLIAAISFFLPFLVFFLFFVQASVYDIIHPGLFSGLSWILSVLFFGYGLTVLRVIHRTFVF